jgi:membrane associated rhomboid family serine protease
MSPTYYYRQYQRPPWGQSFAGTVVGKLIIINVVAFVLQLLFAPHFDLLFALQPRAVVQNFYVWQLLTYMFLHGGVWHLLFNMIVLFFFGSALEMVWGAKRFLQYYLVCGVGAGLTHMAVSYNSAVIGASGAIYGLLLAYAIMYPNQYVLLMFAIPVKVKYLVAGLAAFDLLMGMQGQDGIAHFAHLGGALTGLLFFRSEIRRRIGLSTRSMRAKHKWKTFVHDRRDRQSENETANIDSILDKISAKGYENLTSTEKRILENYSRKRKDESEDD